MTSAETNTGIQRRLRLRRPSLTRQIYEYIVDHGPVSMRAIHLAFPDQNVRTLASLLTVLYRRGDVQRTGDVGEFSYTAQPLPPVEDLPTSHTWLRGDRSNLSSRIYTLLRDRGPLTEAQLRAAVIDEEPHYHRKSVATEIGRMLRNKVIIHDPDQSQRPRRYIIGPNAICSWEDREQPIFGKKRLSMLDRMNESHDMIYRLITRGASARSISKHLGIHVRMAHRWLHDQGWTYDAATGRYWRSGETRYPPTIEDISRDMGGIRLKHLREDAQSGTYSIPELALRYDQTGLRIRRLLQWWKIPIPYQYKTTSLPPWETFRNLPFKDAIDHLPLSLRVVNRLRASEKWMDPSITVDHVRREIGHENGGDLQKIPGIGRDAIRKLRSFLHVKDPEPRLQED